MRPTSEQFCGLSQVSRKCVETMASTTTEGTIGPTLVCFVMPVWEPQGTGCFVTARNQSNSYW